RLPASDAVPAHGRIARTRHLHVAVPDRDRGVRADPAGLDRWRDRAAPLQAQAAIRAAPARALDRLAHWRDPATCGGGRLAGPADVVLETAVAVPREFRHADDAALRAGRVGDPGWHRDHPRRRMAHRAWTVRLAGACRCAAVGTVRGLRHLGDRRLRARQLQLALLIA